VALKLGSTGSALRVGSTTAKYARVGTTLKAVAPPLDIAGSAAAAYSLRKLSYAYTGPVVEVRRSSDDTTADFTADEVEDGTLAAWVGAGNDGFVATWYDQSGNDRDATQATAGSQPQIVDNGSVVTEGGKPAIEFDGSDDFLDIGSLGISGNSPRSVFASVSKASYPSPTGSPFLGRRTGVAVDGQLFELCIESGQFVVRVSGNALFADASNNLQQRLWGVLFSSGNASEIKVFKDGSQLSYTSGNDKTLDTLDSDFAIGSGTLLSSDVYYDGTMQELIVYPSDQTANRTAIEGNLCWHYGLENKLPYNHAEVKPQTLPTDTDVLAFAAASGAVSIPDLLKIEDLVAYLKAQSLWDYARFYPMKSAQNAGSGSTVYGLGGLTSNNMTLVNSPTWGSDGLTFASASSQYGNIGTLGGGESLELLARVAYANATPAAAEAALGYYRSSALNHRYLRLDRLTGGEFRSLRSSSGTGPEVESISSSGQVNTTDMQTVVWSLPEGSNVAFYQNKTQLSNVVGQAGEQAIAAIPEDIFFAAVNDGVAAGTFSDFEASAALLFSGTIPTTTQRETITDLINAL